MDINYNELVQYAILTRERAYAPYSGFKVGAYLVDAYGECYYGCNIENASYSATLCAERAAFAQAIGADRYNFSAIAIVGGKDKIEDFTYPCGVCLQFMSEFCNEDFQIVLFNGNEIRVHTLAELLPNAFKKDALK